jgi:hypothetical protein
MDPTTTQWRFKVGDQVVSADDKKMGKIVRILPDSTKPTHLIVEKGRLMHQDFRVPVQAITNYERGTVYLNMTEEAVKMGGDVSGSETMGASSEEYIG